MRIVSAFVVVLCLSMSMQIASAREASEFKVSEAVVLQCVEIAERSGADHAVAATRECVGRETATCIGVDAGQTAETMMRCAASEAAAWHEIGEKAYAALLAAVAGQDERRAEPALPALRRAHEFWQQSAGQDCTFARLKPLERAGQMDESARCWRDEHAERALLYRRWLRGAKH